MAGTIGGLLPTQGGLLPASFSSCLTLRDICKHLGPRSLQLLCKPRLIFGVIPHWLTNPHPLQLLTPQTGAPVVPLQSLASQTSTHTEENPALRKREMEFNEKRGQTVLIKYRAWPDEPTDQSPVYMWLSPFSPLSLCFPKIFPPQTTCLSPFPCLWFLP